MSINKKETEDKNQDIIARKLNEKVLLDELARKRNEEIEKRKYSNYNYLIEENNTEDNTKYFFDEKVAEKNSNNKNIRNKDLNKTSANKKVLQKKDINIDENIKKEKIVTAFSSKKPIVELRNKEFTEKVETFYFQNDAVELDINQKMKISEYVSQIINKPIKIEIKPNFLLKNDSNSKKIKHLAKSRSLLIRAYLLKLGISHNRIKILMNEDSRNGPVNEVVINFIEL